MREATIHTQYRRLDQVLYAWGQWRNDRSMMKYLTGAPRSIFGIIVKRNNRFTLASQANQFETDGYLERRDYSPEAFEETFSAVDTRVSQLDHYMRSVVVQKYSLGIGHTDAANAKVRGLTLRTFERYLSKARKTLAADPVIERAILHVYR